MNTYERKRISNLEEGQRTILARLLALEATVYGYATDLKEDGDLDMVVTTPGEPPVLVIPPEPLWEKVTAVLTVKQQAALKAAGLNTLEALREEARREDGFIRIDGLGDVADKKLRAALEELK